MFAQYARDFLAGFVTAAFLLTGLTASGAVAFGFLQQPADEPLSSAEVSDEELRQFAKSIEQVLELQEALESELATVQTPEEAQHLQQEANAEMVEVIQGEGLEVLHYNRIARSIPEDPELAVRFQEIREELAEEADES